MRHSATRSLLERPDVIIVASVSCIYGLGSPEAYQNMLVHLIQTEESDRDQVLRKLVEIQYERNDIDFHRGTFRVRGDVVEVFPAYEETLAIRIEFFGDTVDGIFEIDPLRGQVIRPLDRVAIYPASHYVTEHSRLVTSAEQILEEMKQRVDFFRSQNRLIEAQRIEERTRFDVEMLKEMGYANGIRTTPGTDRQAARRASPYPAGVFPQGFPVLHRRVSREHPPDWRHVPWRSGPKIEPGRLRVPASQRPG